MLLNDLILAFWLPKGEKEFKNVLVIEILWKSLPLIGVATMVATPSVPEPQKSKAALNNQNTKLQCLENKVLIVHPGSSQPHQAQRPVMGLEYGG